MNLFVVENLIKILSILFATTTLVSSVHVRLDTPVLPSLAQLQLKDDTIVADSSSSSSSLSPAAASSQAQSRLVASRQSLPGSWKTCFSAQVTISSNNFSVKLDTGSSNFAVPGCSSITSYTGATVPGGVCYDPANPSSKGVTATYADNSYWKGYVKLRNVRLTGTNLTALAPTFLITDQSTAPLFMNSSVSQGIVGLAFSPVASYAAPYAPFPKTLFDAWVAHMKIPNRLAFHACPTSLKDSAYIDFGSDNSYSAGGEGCSAAVGIVKMPMKTFITLDINQILISNSPVTLPSTFQTGNDTDLGDFSILDSCSSLIHLPPAAYTAFVNQIKASGAGSFFNNSLYAGFYTGVSYAVPVSSIDYTKLPTLGVDIKTRNSSLGYTTVTLTLGPKQYMQFESGFLTFMVTPTTLNSYATLGIPYFMAYHIDIDRDLGTVRFQQGCGCSASETLPSVATTNAEVILTPVTSSAFKRGPSTLPAVFCLLALLIF